MNFIFKATLTTIVQNVFGCSVTLEGVGRGLMYTYKLDAGNTVVDLRRIDTIQDCFNETANRDKQSQDFVLFLPCSVAIPTHKKWKFPKTL